MNASWKQAVAITQPCRVENGTNINGDSSETRLPP